MMGSSGDSPATANQGVRGASVGYSQVSAHLLEICLPPIDGSTCKARCAKRGLHAPSINCGSISTPILSISVFCTSISETMPTIFAGEVGAGSSTGRSVPVDDSATVPGGGGDSGSSSPLGKR